MNGAARSRHPSLQQESPGQRLVCCAESGTKAGSALSSWGERHLVVGASGDRYTETGGHSSSRRATQGFADYCSLILSPPSQPWNLTATGLLSHFQFRPGLNFNVSGPFHTRGYFTKLHELCMYFVEKEPIKGNIYNTYYLKLKRVTSFNSPYFPLSMKHSVGVTSDRARTLATQRRTFNCRNSQDLIEVKTSLLL